MPGEGQPQVQPLDDLRERARRAGQEPPSREGDPDHTLDSLKALKEEMGGAEEYTEPDAPEESATGQFDRYGQIVTNEPVD